jgi:hypothetical protein
MVGGKVVTIDFRAVTPLPTKLIILRDLDENVLQTAIQLKEANFYDLAIRGLSDLLGPYSTASDRICKLAADEIESINNSYIIPSAARV